MKKLTFLLSFIILFSCETDNNENQDQQLSELKQISVDIELPNNSNISNSDLTLSSLFTENSNQIIETFDENSMELTFATNNQGNIVMLSYFNPINGDEITMNSETTAIALVMLHPWSFDLTANAKAEAFTFIKNLPEFQSYKETIENSIASGDLNPLNTQPIFDKITQIQNITSQKLTDYIEPIEFNIENSTAMVKNKRSSASYSIGLYDENDVFIEHKLAKGLEKSHLLYQDFSNSNFQEIENSEQTVTFNIPSDGEWKLKAKSGLSFDKSLENQQAAYYNTKTVVSNILGIFSTKLGSLIKNGECYLALGENVFNGVTGSINISSSLELYSNGSKTGYELTKDILRFTWNRFDNVLNIIKNCSTDTTELYGLDKIKSGVFGNILGFLNILSSLENVFNSTAMLTDWVQFDKEIEYCFIKDGNEISDCEIDLFNLLVDTCRRSPLARGIVCSNGNDLQNLLWDRDICFHEDGTITIPICMGPGSLDCNDTGTWSVVNNQTLQIEFTRDIVDDTNYISNSITFQFTGEYNSDTNKFDGSYYYHLTNHNQTNGYTCEETIEVEF